MRQNPGDTPVHNAGTAVGTLTYRLRCMLRKRRWFVNRSRAIPSLSTVAFLLHLLLGIAFAPTAWAGLLPQWLQNHVMPALLIDPTDGTIVDANAAALAFYGYPAETFLGAKKITEINQLNADEVRQEMAAAKTENRNYFVFPHRLADGRVVAVEVYSSPVTLEGKPFLLSFILPESRSTQLQAELQSYQERLEAVVAERTAALETAQQNEKRWYQIALAGLLFIIAGGVVYFATLRRGMKLLAESQHEIELALDAGALGQIHWWLIPEHRFRLCPRFLRILGIAADDHQTWSLAKWRAHIHPDDWPRLEAAIRTVFREGQNRLALRFRIRHADGTWRTVATWGEVVAHTADDRVSEIHGVVRDVTEEVRLTEALERIAYHDPLTGLANRNGLVAAAEQAIKRCATQSGTRLVVVGVLDLDDFDTVNLRYGSATGDNVLKILAERLQSQTMGKMPCPIAWARLGGDEFAFVAQTNEKPEAFERHLQEILDIVALPIVGDGHELRLQASLGYTCYPTENAPAEILLRHAYEALAEAKASGKNTVRSYDVARRHQQQRAAETAIEVLAACESHALALYLQPQVALATGEVTGFEALVRWHHPEKGVIPPGMFLPLIETHDAIVAVGRTMLDAAVHQWLQWHESDPSCRWRIAVNIAPYHLESPAFQADIDALLARYPTFDPRCLTLEVVESGQLRDLAQLQRLLTLLIDRSVRVAIDDFGSGYASLSYLREIPAQEVKIDQSFVRRLFDDDQNGLIVDAVVGLASSFQRITVAEGVETEAIGEMVVRLGVDCAQGYGIAKPMPAQEAAAWAAAWVLPESWRAWQPLRRLPWTRPLAMVELHARTLWVRVQHMARENPENALAQIVHSCAFRQFTQLYGPMLRNLPAWRSIERAHQTLHDALRAWVLAADQPDNEARLRGEVELALNAFCRRLVELNRALYTLALR